MPSLCEKSETRALSDSQLSGAGAPAPSTVERHLEQGALCASSTSIAVRRGCSNFSPDHAGSQNDALFGGCVLLRLLFVCSYQSPCFSLRFVHRTLDRVEQFSYCVTSRSLRTRISKILEPCHGYSWLWPSFECILRDLVCIIKIREPSFRFVFPRLPGSSLSWYMFPR